MTAFGEGVTDIEAVRSLIVAHTDARGNTDQEAVVAGLEALAAPKVALPQRRDRAAAVAAAATQGPLKMTLRPIMDGGCVGQITLGADYLAAHATARTGAPRFVAILDRSGSMGNSVRRLVQTVLPAVCRRLGAKDGDRACVIIAFDDKVQTLNLSLAEMARSPLTCGGGTYMAPAVIAAAREVLKDAEAPVRLLVLSDGELNDQDATCAQSTQLAEQVRAMKINTQAVRFFTSSSQPDTRGLASVLALNTVGHPLLMDLSASMADDAIADSISESFVGDGLDMCAELEADDDILLATPWACGDATQAAPAAATAAAVVAVNEDGEDAAAAENTTAATAVATAAGLAVGKRTVALKPGVNYVWFTRAPKSLKLRGTAVPVDFEVTTRVALADTTGWLKPLMDSYVQRIKMLKVVNTPGTLREIRAILGYFERFDNFVQSGDLTLAELLQNRSIRARLEYFRAMAARRRGSLFGLMNEVANDEKVAKLSAAQQADYLRTVEGSNRNAKALARRALGQGLDFAATIASEVRAMKAHADELRGIDDSAHAVSFYSMETTLGGIRALCSLSDEQLDEMQATDFLQLANIVGAPCAAPIGNFVDPMTWRVDRILPGTHLSLSDILVAHVQSGGRALTAPGYPDVDVTNVIPVFDDARVHHFLFRYAPTLLEYTASVGMRRVLADVPLTYTYTIAAAAWKMVEVLSSAPTEGNVRIFVGFCNDMHAAMRNHFDYVLDYVAQQHNESLSAAAVVAPGKSSAKSAATTPIMSFYIANNGITNMFDPLMQLLSPAMMRDRAKHELRGDAAAVKTTLQRILRAIFAFEVYQVVRRQIKHEAEPDAFIQAQLHSLLGVDLNQRSTPLRPLFEAEPDAKDLDHHCGYAANEAMLRDLAGKMWWIDYIALIPAALAAVGADDAVAHFRKNFRAKSARVICDALGLADNSNNDGADAAAVDDEAAAARTLQRFKLANVVQAFLCPTKADRVDDKNRRMLFSDLGAVEAQRALLEGYVASQYANQYRKDVVAKLKLEKKQVVDELVRRLVTASTMPEYVALLKDGLARGSCAAEVIKDVAHVGYPALRERLLALTDDVPLRLRKLTVLVIGRRDDGDFEPVFNQGNVLVKGLDEVENVFRSLGETRRWRSCAGCGASSRATSTAQMASRTATRTAARSPATSASATRRWRPWRRRCRPRSCASTSACTGAAAASRRPRA